MARLAIPLSVAAIAALAACTTTDPNYPNQPVTSASGTVTAPASGTYVTSTRAGGVAGNPIVYAPATPNATGAVLTPSTSTSMFRAGTGIVESVQLVHINPAPGTPSSSAGANMPQSVAYRLTVKMDDDGSLQAVDQDNSNFRAGDRVRLSGDGRIAQQ